MTNLSQLSCTRYNNNNNNNNNNNTKYRQNNFMKYKNLT